MWPAGTDHLPPGKADRLSGCQVLGKESMAHGRKRDLQRGRNSGAQVSPLERAVCRDGMKRINCVGCTVFMKGRALNEIIHGKHLTGRLQIRNKCYFSSAFSSVSHISMLSTFTLRSLGKVQGYLEGRHWTDSPHPERIILHNVWRCALNTARTVQ